MRILTLVERSFAADSPSCLRGRFQVARYRSAPGALGHLQAAFGHPLDGDHPPPYDSQFREGGLVLAKEGLGGVQLCWGEAHQVAPLRLPEEEAEHPARGRLPRRFEGRP